MMHKDRSAYLGRAMELLRLVGLDDAINKRRTSFPAACVSEYRYVARSSPTPAHS
jgi:hypothetical protein